jgi:hypothetical protein
MARQRLRALGVLAVACVIAALFGATTVRSSSGDSSRARAASGCQLKSSKGRIKHVIFIIFDNVHFLRDTPNVPSDVEQMPHLLNFIRGNGTFMPNDHTVLISHTANGILTNLTGMYSDRHGQAVSNSFRYFKNDGTTSSSSSFKYWTDLTDDTSATPSDPTPIMVTGDSGSPKNTPAPWVPYTRAGCDFGATALANVVLENTGTGPNGDMTKVFGAGSAESAEAQKSNGAPAGSAARNLAQTDFVGIAIHCASGGGICSGKSNARPDVLPDEPGGYNGFQGLFGAKYVNPAITSGAAAVNDLNGRPIGDQFGQPGFPGFDGLFAATTLAYVAQMQEAGVPVTYGYISDAHDQHGVAGEIHATRGPGEADYVQQLKAYDDAFAKFFARLAAHGITRNNTLFAFTVEEGDHFAGSAPTPAGCDGVTTPCKYSLVGEVNANLAGLMAEQGVTTSFTVHADMAPTIYLTGNPARDAAVTRTFGRTLAALNRVNPYTGQTENLTVGVADTIGMRALHMVTADPQRTPTLTMFAQPDWFLFATQPPPNCKATPCVTVPTTPPTSTFAWNHGGVQPEIRTTWLGLVGPGVRKKARDTTWVDHTDVRPTMLRLVGLRDSYVHDGRVLVDQLQTAVLPRSLRAHRLTLRRLGAIYKQLNAPFGTFSMNMLAASTKAIRSGSSADDATYASLESRMQALTSRRDAVARQIRAALDRAAFRGVAIKERQTKQWLKQAQALLRQAAALAAA